MWYQRERESRKSERTTGKASNKSDQKLPNLLGLREGKRGRSTLPTPRSCRLKKGKVEKNKSEVGTKEDTAMDR